MAGRAGKKGSVRISLVTETFPPEVNGVAMTWGRLVAGLRERGEVVEVVRPRQVHECPDTPVPAGEWVVPGMPIPFYRSLRVGLPVSHRLRQRWTAPRPDVVHVATEGPLGWAALQAARALGLPVTSSYHTNFHQYGAHYGIGLGRSLALGWMRRFHNATRCTLVPTRQMKAELEVEGFVRLGILSRGVDTRLFAPTKRNDALRAAWGAERDDLVAIHVGRMAAEKNLGLAVEAFEAIRQRVPRAKFVLVGDGPERAAVAAAHPDYHYAGMRRGEELAAHYASADLFLFPSVTETFGNVVTEAMASGLVVLGFDYAASREHIEDGRNGYLATFGDRSAFTRRAADIVRQRAQWPMTRQAARARMQACTWGAIVGSFAESLRLAAKTAD